jgi:5-methyltetrahydrofolate--homocysteine methyltransferase
LVGWAAAWPPSKLAPMPSFSQVLNDADVLLTDGACGTNFQDMGIEPGVAPEEWVFDAPERVQDLHRRFAQAGSQMVLTCSFGGSPIRLLDGPLAGRGLELNRRAAELAREAVGDDVLVAGSIGPSGQLPEPLGLLGRDAALETFAEQARGLTEGPVDLLVLETFFAMEEALWAGEAIRTVTDLPLVMSFSFDQGTRTMMGLSAADVVSQTASLGLAAVGGNCGRSLEDTAQLTAEFVAAEPAVPLWIKPNAGVPQIVGDGVVYPEDPASFAPKVAALAAAGARLVGGCCGSTPEHLAALRAELG